MHAFCVLAGALSSPPALICHHLFNQGYGLVDSE
jgi:hypothetical protein